MAGSADRKNHHAQQSSDDLSSLNSDELKEIAQEEMDKSEQYSDIVED